MNNVKGILKRIKCMEKIYSLQLIKEEIKTIINVFDFLIDTCPPNEDTLELSLYNMFSNMINDRI